MRKPTHIEAREGRSGLSEQQDQISVPFFHSPVDIPKDRKKVSIRKKIQDAYHTWRVERSWKKLERTISKTLRKLSNKELQEMPDYFYYHQQREQWMIRPEITGIIKQLLSPILNDSGSVPASVTLIMKDIYIAEMKRRQLI